MVQIPLAPPGQKGLLWVEPLRDFVNTAHSAGKLSSLTEISEIKTILEKSGTNRLLKDKKISFDLVEPFTYINNDRGLGALEDYSITKNKTGEKVLTTNSPVWWCPLESNH